MLAAEQKTELSIAQNSAASVQEARPISGQPSDCICEGHLGKQCAKDFIFIMARTALVYIFSSLLKCESKISQRQGLGNQSRKEGPGSVLALQNARNAKDVG